MSVLVNPTWWVLCGALAVILLARDPRAALASCLRLATRTPVFLVLAAAVGVNVGARAILGHAVPGDFVQEVVAARTIQSGTTLYPGDVNAEVRSWLAQDPPTLPSWLPPLMARWLAARQQEGRNRLVGQAHPPTLLMATAPLVLALGPYGAYWALTLISIGAAALTALALVSVFSPGATPRERIVAVLLFASWQPVLATVRDGQWSVIIATLLVGGWHELRRGRDVAGGLAIGAAAALKLYPLLLLVAPAVRRRRALTAALAVIGGAAGAVMVVGGPGLWREYAESAQVIAGAFKDAPYNLSLVARLAGVTGSAVWVAYPVLAAVFVGLTLRAGGRLAAADYPTMAFDVEFASLVALALVLSPVAWHHYVAMLALPLAFIAQAAWARGSRARLAAVLGLALVLSVPDDAWRVIWGESSAVAAVLASPGVAAIVLWATVLETGRRAATAR